MDDLIIRALREQVSPDEQLRLRAWRAAAPANETRYQELAQVWRLTAMDPALPPVPSGARLTRLAYRRRAVRALPVAAGITFLAAFVAFWLYPRLQTVEIIAAAPRAVALPDGSLARLAAGSSLSYRISRRSRRAEVAGSVFLAVAPDVGRPFVVTAGSVDVTVTGTRFLVQREGVEADVLVIDGRVVVQANGRQEVLTGSSGARRGAGGSLTRYADPDPWARLGSLGGVILLQTTPVSRFAAELRGRFGRTVLLDTALANRTVTGLFDESDLDQAVRAVCAVIGARCAISADTVRISP